MLTNRLYTAFIYAKTIDLDTYRSLRDVTDRTK
jgi:hypothetical protein